MKSWTSWGVLVAVVGVVAFLARVAFAAAAMRRWHEFGGDVSGWGGGDGRPGGDR